MTPIGSSKIANQLWPAGGIRQCDNICAYRPSCLEAPSQCLQCRVWPLQAPQQDGSSARDHWPFYVTPRVHVDFIILQPVVVRGPKEEIRPVASAACAC